MKKFFLFLLLLSAYNSIAFSQDNNRRELLIIAKNIILYEEANSNSRKIRTLDFLEKVYLIKEGINNQVFVSTENNEKGWVSSLNTSFIPSSWKRINDLDEFSFYLPTNIKYSFKKGIFEKHRMGKKYVESREDKFFVENKFAIIINRSDETFNEVYEKEKIADKVLKRNSVYIEKYFKHNKLIFNNSNGMDFSSEYFVLLQYKEDSYISILISPEDSNPSPEEIRTALKILFSFELKK